MPARRPYASRGVPRRVTTSQSGGARSGSGLAALVGGLVLAGVWLTNPFGSVRGPAADLAADGTADGPALRMADVAAPATTSNAGGGNADLVPTSVPTLRHWDAGGAAVVADTALVERLDQALVGVDGQVGLVVKDLASGRGAVLDGDRELPAASLYKLPVLYSVFEAGLNLAEPLPITQDARAYDSGTLELGVGESLTVAEALERMITLSDNTSAVMLGSRVGGAQIKATIGALGLDNTHYSLTRMTTSALDMLHLLELIGRGKAVSPAASADMLHLLLRQRVNDRLPRLLPAEARVAHKTGNLPGTVNDVGVVFGPTSTVAIAALVADTRDEAAAATGIARAAQVAYTFFESQSEDARRPVVPARPTRAVPPVWREPRPVPTPTPTPTISVTAAAPIDTGTAAAPTAFEPALAATAVPPTAVPPTARPTPPPAPTPAPTPPPATATPAAGPTRAPTVRPATQVPTATAPARR